LSIKKTIRFLLFFIAALSGSNVAGQSVLASGAWYKLSINENGVYRINYSLLRKMGINPDNVDPRNISIHGFGGGMLPQGNDVSRHTDLPEVAIYISGEDDGRFNKQDYILFYGESADRIEFNSKADTYFYENNLYSDENFYFLTVSNGPGKRIGFSENVAGSFPLVDQFDDYAYHESDNYNVLTSGREWYGEKFDSNTNTLSLTFSIPGIVPSSQLHIVSDIMGQTYSTGSLTLLMNRATVGKQEFFPISDSRYALKGQDQRDTLTISENIVNASGVVDQVLQYQFTKGSGYSQAYLDHLLLSVKRKLMLYGNQTIFTSGASTLNAVSTFKVDNAVGSTIWDISDPINVQNQAVVQEGETMVFSTATTTLKKFVIFNNNPQSPSFIGKVPTQNLHGLATPNLVIITHPLFEAEAQRLAAHRENFSQWTATVVTTQEIYNEFSSGRQDVTALRDFIKLLYDKSPATLRAALFIGKGSYDYKDRVPNNSNFVAAYESRNSLHPLQTYSSDDFFGFLENNEGEWGEDPVQNHTLDIGVGRFSVTTAEEAKNIIDKIIRYDTDKKSYGYWRKEITFVADDGNSEDGFTSLHQLHADDLANYIESTHPEFDTRKLFLGTYTKTISPGGEAVPEMTDDIVRTFEKGSVIINYTGHGSEKVWADERVFTNQVIAGLTNKLYPFLVTATCEFGRQDDPVQTSSAVLCLVQKNGGAIGMVSTARPVNATSNFSLNQAFYEALFERENNRYHHIGEVFRQTKNNSTSGVSNRNFSLLADPSMTLALPVQTAVITSIQTASGSDTLKALSTVHVTGEIQNDLAERITNFNGILQATLFDKKEQMETVGRNDPPFEFSQWKNAIFRGQASVKDGTFEFDFIVSKNIAYTIGPGKLALYASDASHTTDAKGSASELKIGGTEKDVATDSQPPSIALFMGDTTFRNGGITTPNPELVVRLRDNSGVNISGYGVGNSLVATLDDDAATYILNDYYIADADNSAQGWVSYPLHGLSPGRHKLNVKAWDVYNNASTATIDFIVTDGEALVIESFGNFPNPFQEKTTLFFTHNRTGDELEAELFIYDLAGNRISELDILIPESSYQVNLMEFDNSGDVDKKLSPGVYLARIHVRSITNGSKNEQVTKLVILN
jgi:hypothetical protein